MSLGSEEVQYIMFINPLSPLNAPMPNKSFPVVVTATERPTGTFRGVQTPTSLGTQDSSACTDNSGLQSSRSVHKCHH